MFTDNLESGARASASHADGETIKVAQAASDASNSFLALVQQSKPEKMASAPVDDLLAVSRVANPMAMVIGSTITGRRNAPNIPLQPGNVTLADALAGQRAHYNSYTLKGFGAAGVAAGANYLLESDRFGTGVFKDTKYGASSGIGDSLASAVAFAPVNMFGSKAFLAKTVLMTGSHIVGRTGDYLLDRKKV